MPEEKNIYTCEDVFAVFMTSSLVICLRGRNSEFLATWTKDLSSDVSSWLEVLVAVDEKRGMFFCVEYWYY